MMRRRLHAYLEQLACLQGNICLASSRELLSVGRNKQDEIEAEMP